MIDFRFYLVTDRKRCAPRSLQSVVRQACDAGARAVQLREKDLSGKELEAHVEHLLGVAHDRGARLILNRSQTISTSEQAFMAASLGVDGFHFAESLAFPHELRRRFPKLIVGISTHSLDRAVAADTEGADFVTFGPIFDTPAKRAFGAPHGLEALSTVAARLTIPVFAIGGVTAGAAADCIAAGARGVAAIGAVMGEADVARAVARFEAALGGL